MKAADYPEFAREAVREMHMKAADYPEFAREAVREMHTMKAADYPEFAREAVREMYRQVGSLETGEEGLARRGLIVRHLVMPGHLDETQAILRWVAEELGPDTYVNLMDQYYPAGVVGEERFPEINRKLHPEEFAEAWAVANELGLRNLDRRRPHRKLRMLGVR